MTTDPLTSDFGYCPRSRSVLCQELVSPARHPRFTAVSRVLIAMVFGLVVSVNLVHEATTTHIRCAEHGELSHVVSDDATEAAVAPGADSIVHSRPALELEHEHCVLGCGAWGGDGQSPPALGVGLAEHRLTIAVPRLAAVHRGGLYRTAPKTSPPA